jgi:hypothetical protein
VDVTTPWPDLTAAGGRGQLLQVVCPRSKHVVAAGNATRRRHRTHVRSPRKGSSLHGTGLPSSRGELDGDGVRWRKRTRAQLAASGWGSVAPGQRMACICAQPRERDRGRQAGKAGPPSDETTTRGAAPRHACRAPLLISSACTQIFSPTPAGVASISGSFEFGARPRPVAADMGIKSLLPRLFRWQ